MLAKNNEYLTEATVTLHEMTEDERIREQCEAREKYYWDLASATAKGHREGKAEGIAEGKAQEIIEFAKEVGWSKEQILERLQDKLNISQDKAIEYWKQFN